MEPAAALAPLAPLVGTWTERVHLPDVPLGSTTLEWALDGRYLVQRSGGAPPVPDSLSIIAPDGEAFLQHYFDARGVVRTYRMTFDGTRWTLLRDAPDFSPLGFFQRYAGVLTGDRIDGAWEKSDDGVAWELDFELTFTRA